MNRISFLNRGYAFKGLLAVFEDKCSFLYIPFIHIACLFYFIFLG